MDFWTLYTSDETTKLKDKLYLSSLLSVHFTSITIVENIHPFYNNIHFTSYFSYIHLVQKSWVRTPLVIDQSISLIDHYPLTIPIIVPIAILELFQISQEFVNAWNPLREIHNQILFEDFIRNEHPTFVDRLSFSDHWEK